MATTTFRVALIALNIMVISGLISSLSVLAREGVVLPWRTVGRGLVIIGYAHLVWMMRPKVAVALVGAAVYWLVITAIVFVVATSIVITLYGQ